MEWSGSRSDRTRDCLVERITIRSEHLHNWDVILGVSLCLCSAFCGVLNIFYRQKQKKLVPLFLVRHAFGFHVTVDSIGMTLIHLFIP